MKNKFIFIILIISIFNIQVQAANTIDDFLDKVVGGIYVNKGGDFKTSHYAGYKGPSFGLRLKTDALNMPIVALQPPSMSVSCAGFDFDAGMIGLLDLDTFQDMLTQAGSQLAWGVAIGIIYSLPGIGDAFNTLQTWARNIQKLFQAPCQAGITMGKHLAHAVASNVRSDAAAKDVIRGVASDFSRAITQSETSIPATNVYKTLPFTTLKMAGIDGELAGLIAAVTGVYNVVLTKDDGSSYTYSEVKNKTVAEVLGDRKIDAALTVNKFLPLPSASFETIIYGNKGKSGIYVCIGSLSEVCDSVDKHEVSSVKGLKERMSNYLDKLITDTVSGNITTETATDQVGSSPSSLTIFYMFNTIFGDMDFKSIYDHMVSLKMNGETAQLLSMQANIADVAAILIAEQIVTLFNDIQTGMSKDKQTSETISQVASEFTKQLENGIRAFKKYIKDNAEESMRKAAITQAFINLSRDWKSMLKKKID